MLRCAIMECGVQCVAVDGEQLMLPLCADNWDTPVQVLASICFSYTVPCS